MLKGKAIKHKVGDTLIEVTFAIGIFSMVAIAAVSVISASTSGSQNILENTITREEIDTQAEAIRFIQAAYSASGEQDMGGSINEDNKYAYLWQAMTKRAIDPSDEVMSIVNNYEPSSCNELYTDTPYSLIKQKAFIINPRAISSSVNNSYVDNVVITPNPDNMGRFYAASTYPRLVYSDTNDDVIANVSKEQSLDRAEGLFVVAVKDGSDTVIIDEDGSEKEGVSAYIDFYIRSCWFATGAERPSTISTVIRLYNPDEVSENKYGRERVIINYAPNGGSGSMPSKIAKGGETIAPYENQFKPPSGNRVFLGWKDEDGNKYMYSYTNNTFSENFTTPAKGSATLTAIWGWRYTLNYYNTNQADIVCTQEILSETKAIQYFSIQDEDCVDKLTKPSGKDFQGWSKDKTNGAAPLYSSNIDGTERTITTDKYTTNLYPVWRKVITFSNSTWKPSDENAKSNCYVFQKNCPSGVDCISISENDKWNGQTGIIIVGPGKPKHNSYTYYTSYDGYAKAPMDGFLVWEGKLIELYDKGINLQGKCRPAATASVYYDIGINDTFELEANLNTSNLLPHPDGRAYVSIGPVTVYLNGGSSYSYTCSANSGKNGSGSFDSTTPNIKITKYGNKYSFYVDSTTKISDCTKSESSVKVTYGMNHDSHNCGKLFNVQLTNIEMRQEVQE